MVIIFNNTDDCSVWYDYGSGSQQLSPTAVQIPSGKYVSLDYTSTGQNFTLWWASNNGEPVVTSENVVAMWLQGPTAFNFGALAQDVNITNATITVEQGGDWNVNITNASLDVAQSGDWSVAITNASLDVAQSGDWSVAITNATLNVEQSGDWVISGNVTINEGVAVTNDILPSNGLILLAVWEYTFPAAVDSDTAITVYADGSIYYNSEYYNMTLVSGPNQIGVFDGFYCMLAFSSVSENGVTAVNTQATFVGLSNFNNSLFPNGMHINMLGSDQSFGTSITANIVGVWSEYDDPALYALLKSVTNAPTLANVVGFGGFTLAGNIAESSTVRISFYGIVAQEYIQNLQSATNFSGDPSVDSSSTVTETLASSGGYMLSLYLNGYVTSQPDSDGVIISLYNDGVMFYTSYIVFPTAGAAAVPFTISLPFSQGVANGGITCKFTNESGTTIVCNYAGYISMAAPV